MTDNLVHNMSRGIEKSMVMLVFVTKAYSEKIKQDGDNCHKEFM